MERCETCKFWEHPKDTGVRTILGVCSNRKLGGDCDTGPGAYQGRDALDGSGGEYKLEVGPDFGCIHHEPKEA